MGPLTLTVNDDTCALGGYPLFHRPVGELLDEVQRLRAEQGVHLIITVNVDQILSMERDPAAHSVLTHATIRTIDGAPIRFLARALGAQHVSRITGADLITDVTSAAQARHWTIAILGGAPGTGERAAEQLRAATDWGRVHAVSMPLLSTVDDPAGAAPIKALRELNPDVVFVCMGAPKQEAWVLRWVNELPDAVYIGAGAAVDFAAGTKTRAPKVVQSLGAEWVWRLAQEPRRLAHRYLVRGPGFARVAIRSMRPSK
jgi:N-acetylglucosaminyldiphosphoundecaprenol N-acetyl-beta-D-mannosaminyltransferase